MNTETLEQHFTVGELAERWKLHPDSIRRIFQAEPGVLMLGRKVGRGRRRSYVTMRIPASVAERVHRERSRGKAA